jgi:hypothetical protein
MFSFEMAAIFPERLRTPKAVEGVAVREGRGLTHPRYFSTPRFRETEAPSPHVQDLYPDILTRLLGRHCLLGQPSNFVCVSIVEHPMK